MCESEYDQAGGLDVSNKVEAFQGNGICIGGQISFRPFSYQLKSISVRDNQADLALSKGRCSSPFPHYREIPNPIHPLQSYIHVVWRNFGCGGILDVEKCQM